MNKTKEHSNKPGKARLALRTVFFVAAFVPILLISVVFAVYWLFKAEDLLSGLDEFFMR